MYLDGLDGKRVDAALIALAAAVQVALEKASLPEATDEDIKKANSMVDAYDAEINRYAAKAGKKKKTGFKKIVTAYEGTFKKAGKIDPTFKKHAESVERRKRLDQLKIEGMRLQGQRPGVERDAKLNDISSEMQRLAKKEKKYLKQVKIVALIVSIVVGIFTFGSGTVGVQSAFQALKAGAVEAAKKFLMGAAASAAAKGASASDVKKANQVALDLEKYPPDPNLSTFEAMLQDSQMKKQIVTEKNVAILVPVGVIAALTFLS